eukprot:scaffold59935_cov27-Phaeocystis_antarctica.AAC.1
MLTWPPESLVRVSPSLNPNPNPNQVDAHLAARELLRREDVGGGDLLEVVAEHGAVEAGRDGRALAVPGSGWG